MAGQRDGGGRFTAGESGNPAGRRKGSRNRTTELCADLLDGDAEAIMERLIKGARKGDPIALRLCVERLIPVRGSRDRTVTFDLPAIARAADLVGAAAEVLAHAASGAITLSEAKEFLALLDGQRRMIETAELAVRLEALEVRVLPGGGGVTVAPGSDPEMLARIRSIALKHALEDGGVKR
jgi:hypothetical protein